MTAAQVLHLRSTGLRQALLPSQRSASSFLASLGLHVAGLVLMLWLPISFQAQADMAITTADLMNNPRYRVEMLPVLPKLGEARSANAIKFRAQRAASGKAGRKSTSSRLGLSSPKIDYASPQEIVSDLPDWTNNVQTIRRPDLVEPPKMKFPIRVPSLVMLPASPAHSLATQQQAAPQVDQRSLSLPELALNAKPTLALPTLPIQAPKGPAAKVADQAPPKIADALSSDRPSLAAKVDKPALPKVDGPLSPKAVVVLNAVSVPAESAPAIPDAELAGRFVVGPHGGSGSLDSKPAKPGESSSGPEMASAAKNELSISPGTGAAGPGGPSSGAPRSGSLSIAGAASVSGGAAAESGGNGTVPGISISGGTSGGGSSRALASGSLAGNPYGLTIISSGRSGGFTRNFGVFGRQETVYTVYIPMADAGGGHDWPMEYALLHPGEVGSSGLVTPPIAIQKVQAKILKKDMTANSALVYVTGTIDENGVPNGLRPILGADPRSKCAVEALSQWIFKPAQLDGNPVASKVLIGVAIQVAE